MVITFKKETSAHQNGHARAHHAAMAFSEVAFVNGLGTGMRGECAVKFRYKKASGQAGSVISGIAC
ncbi:hypothetical protein DOO61_06675 [Salmonella enterica]|nr:hypothetical protein [Salmonella enterica]ECQ9522582.1 hypothetical protein [Salmonella enterica]